jgi:hypothetical protein
MEKTIKLRTAALQSADNAKENFLPTLFKKTGKGIKKRSTAKSEVPRG